MCSIQRPLDTKSQPRIAVEAEAILGVLMLCEAGQVDLMTSDAFELERNPHPVRKEYALKVLSKAAVFVHTDSQIKERARIFLKKGSSPSMRSIWRRQWKRKPITSARAMIDS